MVVNRERIIEQLLESEEPSIRWKIRVKVLGEARDSDGIQTLGKQVKA